MPVLQLTEPDQKELQEAVEILVGYGATKVLLFGSAARGEAHRLSDIDLACEGIPPRKFFKALGELLSTLRVAIDLVDLHGDNLRDSLRDRIEREGVLLYESQ